MIVAGNAQWANPALWRQMDGHGFHVHSRQEAEQAPQISKPMILSDDGSLSYPGTGSQQWGANPELMGQIFDVAYRRRNGTGFEHLCIDAWWRLMGGHRVGRDSANLDIGQRGAREINALEHLLRGKRGAVKRGGTLGSQGRHWTWDGQRFTPYGFSCYGLVSSDKIGVEVFLGWVRHVGGNWSACLVHDQAVAFGLARTSPGRYQPGSLPFRLVARGNGDGPSMFDLSKLDDALFDRLTAAVSAAHRVGVALEVRVFDQYSMTAFAQGVFGWDYNPWNPSNNVNGLGPITANTWTRTTGPIADIQELVLRRTVAAITAAEGGGQNVALVPMNEAGRGGDHMRWHLWCEKIIRDAAAGALPPPDAPDVPGGPGPDAPAPQGPPGRIDWRRVSKLGAAVIRQADKRQLRRVRNRVKDLQRALRMS